jgi:16S rRNA (guanine527-N7)-methyltransferase
MDEPWQQRLITEAEAVGVAVSADAARAMALHVDLLLQWNPKINLTSITEPDAVRIKHCVDSLAGLLVLPAGERSVLDMGAGAGFPGIPWLCVRPELRLTMVDSVAKKVAFIKTALAQVRLVNGRAVHARLGAPEARAELGTFDVVVSRAFMDLEQVLPLTREHLAPNGSVVAMLGPRETPEVARQVAHAASFDIADERSFALPAGAGERRVVRLVPRGT